jgi:guanidinoacetate N-methyltransferase
MDTIKTRKAIGFPKEKIDWAKAPAIFDEHTLRITGHPVMEDWELGYMWKLAQIVTTNGGRILEVGYGMGLSAKAIQSHKIDSHYVIECHPGVIAKCVEDCHIAISENRLHILTGFWQDITSFLANETFDGILFDTYPLVEEEIHSNHFWFFAEAYRLLKSGGILTYYSDEINNFSDRHISKLQGAGFKIEHINSEICNVDPPENCAYWKYKTILAPIIRK